MKITEKMKEDWNRRAEHHARFWIATENYHTEQDFDESGNLTAQDLLTSLEGRHASSWHVLEIGCGIGRVLKPLAPYFQRLVGVDVSPSMIKQSKEWLKDWPHIQTFETSGVDLQQFPKESFELVYSYVAFQHMPRSVFVKYLEEINRVLKPKGYLTFQLPIGPYRDVPDEDTIGIRSYSLEEIQDTLRRNGFSCLRQEAFAPREGKPAPVDHMFHRVQKQEEISFSRQEGWKDLQQPNLPSELDARLYMRFAQDCLDAGNSQEMTNTLYLLVQQHPEYLAGWLTLILTLLEAGNVQEALFRLKDLLHHHPNYLEGKAILQRLLKQYAHLSPTLLHHSKNDCPPLHLSETSNPLDPLKNHISKA